MESSKKLVCSSSTRLPYQEVVKVQAWSEEVQRIGENCLMDDYVSSLPEEVHLDLAQNKLIKLANLWELVREQVLGPIWTDCIIDNGRGR